MTYKKLIESYAWPSISSVFLQIYPDAENDIQGYKSVFEKLVIMKPEETDLSIILDYVKNPDEEYIEVSGLHNNPKNQEETYPQGIELTPWHKWLGMDISKEALDAFSEQEIIVHCLYEMTFAGFCEKDIPNANRCIEQRINERESEVEDGQ